MNRNNNVFVVRVIEKVTEDGTFLKEKRVIKAKEEALSLYKSFSEKYPSFTVEVYDYKEDEIIMSTN